MESAYSGIPEAGRVDCGVHQHQIVILAVAREATDTCKQSNIETTDRFVLRECVRMLPTDNTDLVIVDGGAEMDRVTASVFLAGKFFSRTLPFDNRRRLGRRRDVGKRRGFATENGQRFAIARWNRGGGVNSHRWDLLWLYRNGSDEVRDVERAGNCCPASRRRGLFLTAETGRAKKRQTGSEAKLPCFHTRK
jgi:hypothetical protein